MGEHPQDRRVDTVLGDDLPGYEPRGSLEADAGSARRPKRYGVRSFDRAWILPDKRLVNRPNPGLWQIGTAPGQLFLTALDRTAPTAGPAVTATALVPDLDHHRGSFGGRAFPLFLDSAAQRPNVPAGLLAALRGRLGQAVSGVFGEMVLAGEDRRVAKRQLIPRRGKQRLEGATQQILRLAAAGGESVGEAASVSGDCVVQKRGHSPSLCESADGLAWRWCNTRCTLDEMPTKHPRHIITETGPVAEAFAKARRVKPDVHVRDLVLLGAQAIVEQAEQVTVDEERRQRAIADLIVLSQDPNAFDREAAIHVHDVLGVPELRDE